MQVRLLSGPAGLTALLRLDRTAGLLTLNLDAPALPPAGSRYKDGEVAGRWLFSGQNEVVSWAGEVAAGLGCEPGLLPALTRGLQPSPYWTTTDDRLVESGLQRVVHQEQSQYQHIQVECDALHWADTLFIFQVVETSDCGRALLLDGQVRSGTSCSVSIGLSRCSWPRRTLCTRRACWAGWTITGRRC